jgi:1-acyl-sn-glycerol-3-phosphate acyltransferase
MATQSPIDRDVAATGAAGQRREAAGVVPSISPLWLGLFSWYARRFVARHFHAVRLAGTAALPEAAPVVVYSNHASWWDPMLLMLLAAPVTPGRAAYAPVDAQAIERYSMFKRMGFFGVEQNSSRGAVAFLRTSEAVLSLPHTALWLTPQGRFADVRERPLRFQRGLGLLARRLKGAWFVPVGIEYSFWEERLPEVLVRVGDPIHATAGQLRTSEEWVALFEDRLTQVQDQLARDAIQRSTESFSILLRGRSGVNPVYDAWRRLKARLQGKTFRPDHGEL